MAADVIMPALGMAQENGKIVQWLKHAGAEVTRGEPLLEIETDKITVEIEAPASGILANVSAAEGDEVPVGQVIAQILAPGEAAVEPAAPAPVAGPAATTPAPEAPDRPDGTVEVVISPVAARIAAEHNLDPRQVKPGGGRIQKADVLAYLAARAQQASTATVARLSPASPKARRLARERGLEIGSLKGSGPDGAVLTTDVLAVVARPTPPTPAPAPQSVAAAAPQALTLSTAWRVMAERTTQSWTSVPHFYLLREVDAGAFITWRDQAQKRATQKLTFTDLLVKVVAVALRAHSRLNATWKDGGIVPNDEINVGLAVAVEDGLIVPAIHRADTLSLSDIAARRQEVVTRAQNGTLRPDDIRGVTFTISNLGMYGVDAFNAIVNAPQAAILAVGRIARRVVPVDDQPAVRSMMTLSLSCDHRVVDGARGAQFLATVAELIEAPLGLVA